jgi:hypothetical protein
LPSTDAAGARHERWSRIDRNIFSVAVSVTAAVVWHGTGKELPKEIFLLDNSSVSIDM